MSKSETLKVEANSFPDVSRVLREEGYEPGVLVIDLDYTLRMSLKHGIRGRFGEIPQSSIDHLDELASRDWAICIVTNQPKKGHQIARLIASQLKYPFFPDTLVDKFGEDAIFGGGDYSILPWGQHYKKSDEAIKEVSKFIDTRNDSGAVIVIGDRASDLTFAKKLGADVFVKLPDPPYMKTIYNLPEGIRKIILRLIP